VQYTDGDLDNRLFIVSVPGEGEFYAAGQRLTREALAVAMRDAFIDKPAAEQKVYLRCSALLTFGAVRQAVNVVRQAGYSDIGFIVKSGNSPRDAILAAHIFVPFDVKVDPADRITIPPVRPVSSTKPPPPPPPSRPPPPPARSSPRPIKAPIDSLDSSSLVVETKAQSGSSEPAVALNTQVMAMSKLRALLQDQLEQRPEKHVFIKPSRDTSYSDVIAVMDAIKAAGSQSILLVIDEVAVPRGISRPNPPPPVGVPGGVPGGVPSGVEGGVPDDRPKTIRKVPLIQSATHRVDPATPPAARAAKVTGTVVVEVVVDTQGDVISARAISGHPLLRDAAIEAARGWKFEPGQLHGKPVKVIGTLALTFK
jgi:TonB family protein